MLIQAKYAGPIADGRVTLTFRRWKRLQVLPGRRYRTRAGMIEVDAIDVVTAAQITDADAARAGYPSAAALIEDLRNTDDLPIYRIALHGVRDADPRDVLAADGDLRTDDIAAITARLDRLDRASSFGPWTRPTLRAIAARPAVRAPDLAASFGRETAPFKLDVRKLKAMGLTKSLPVGYQLSPRGTAYLEAID
ncbi:MAG: hypothetical protein ACR2F6_07840 [Mycobacteriales bacterium]